MPKAVFRLSCDVCNCLVRPHRNDPEQIRVSDLKLFRKRRFSHYSRFRQGFNCFHWKRKKKSSPCWRVRLCFLGGCVVKFYEARPFFVSTRLHSSPFRYISMAYKSAFATSIHRGNTQNLASFPGNSNSPFPSMCPNRWKSGHF